MSFEILVVSSDSGSRHDLEDTLARLGLEAKCVSTLRECQETLHSGTVGLVFCDPHVADGDYQDLLSSCGDHKPALVVTSRTVAPQDFRNARECGAFDVISTPPRPMEVEWMVIQARRHAQREKPGHGHLQFASAAGHF